MDCASAILAAMQMAERLRDEEKAPDERWREEERAPDERWREGGRAPDERWREEEMA